MTTSVHKMQRNVAPLLFLAAFLGLLLPRHAAQTGDLPQAQELAFSTELAGVDRSGNSVWEGRVAGGARGVVRIALRQVESPSQAANPVWHVRSRWSVEAPAGRSFVAELEGMVDWKTGASRLSGAITRGWMRGAWVEEESRFVEGEPTGTLRIIPSLATR